MSGGVATQLLPSTPKVARRDDYGSAQTQAPQSAEDYQLCRFIANGFSLVQFCAFASPFIISLEMACDPDVAFWIGEWGYLVFLVPVIIITQHILHFWMLRKPHRMQRSIFIAVPVSCAVIVGIVGCIYYSMGRYFHGQLASHDCNEGSSVYAKYWLQQAYDEAYAVHQQCNSRLQAENGGMPLLRQPTLPGCEEWRDFLDARRGEKTGDRLGIGPGGLKQFSAENFALQWEYLSWVEAEHICGGFCDIGPSLFVSSDLLGRAGGACAHQVAFKFLSVSDNGFKILIIGLLIFALAVPSYFFAIPQLKALGYRGESPQSLNMPF